MEKHFPEFKYRTWQKRRVAWNKTQILFARPQDTKVIDSIPLSEVTDVALSTQKKIKFKTKESEEDKAKVSEDYRASFFGETWSEGRKEDITDQRGNTADLNRTGSAQEGKAYDLTADAEDKSLAKKSGPKASEQHPAYTSDQKTKSCSGECEILHIKTKTDGFNSGRTYCLRTDRTGTCQDISADLMRKARAARIREDKLTKFQKNQMQMRRLYNSSPFQASVSLMIVAVRALSAPLFFTGSFLML